MTTVEALKEVYTSLGGELTDTYPSIADGAPVSDYVIIPDVISAISVKATGAIELPTTTAEDNGKLLTVVNGAWNKANATAELPAVTADDNGDVLTVVSGEWAKAAAASGSQIVYFDVNYASSSSGVTLTLLNNKTVADVIAEITNGNVVYLKYGNKLYNLTSFSNAPSLSNPIGFMHADTPNNDSSIYFIYVKSISASANTFAGQRFEMATGTT